MKEPYLGIPGVDDPYPKHVQDALDLVERETLRYTTLDRETLRQLWADDVARQQTKRPYQPFYSADEVSLFPGIQE